MVLQYNKLERLSLASVLNFVSMFYNFCHWQIGKISECVCICLLFKTTLIFESKARVRHVRRSTQNIDTMSNICDLTVSEYSVSKITLGHERVNWLLLRIILQHLLRPKKFNIIDFRSARQSSLCRWLDLISGNYGKVWLNSYPVFIVAPFKKHKPMQKNNIMVKGQGSKKNTK